MTYDSSNGLHSSFVDLLTKFGGHSTLQGKFYICSSIFRQWCHLVDALPKLSGNANPAEHIPRAIYTQAHTHTHTHPHRCVLACLHNHRKTVLTSLPIWDCPGEIVLCRLTFQKDHYSKKNIRVIIPEDIILSSPQPNTFCYPNPSPSP